MRWATASPRALCLAALRDVWKMARPTNCGSGPAEDHGPGVLSEAERARLDRPLRRISRSYRRRFSGMACCRHSSAPSASRAAEEGAALAERAPIDLRVNTLKADRPKLLAAFAKFGAVAGPLSPWCVRIAAARSRCAQSQCRSRARPWQGLVRGAGRGIAGCGTDVWCQGRRAGADICAGAGGKTLALAAMMKNKGQIHAHDADRHRLRPIFERLQRAGARNVQVIGADEGARLTSSRQARLRVDRCALLRLRELAAEARRQMAADREAASNASRSSATCWTRVRLW